MAWLINGFRSEILHLLWLSSRDVCVIGGSTPHFHTILMRRLPTVQKFRLIEALGTTECCCHVCWYTMKLLPMYMAICAAQIEVREFKLIDLGFKHSVADNTSFGILPYIERASNCVSSLTKKAHLTCVIAWAAHDQSLTLLFFPSSPPAFSTSTNTARLPLLLYTTIPKSRLQIPPFLPA